MAKNWFKIYELVPRDTYALYPEYRLWWLFDRNIIITANRIRERYGKMLANTWWWNGKHQYRGWRPWDCPVGAELSQHKFGRALDLEPVEVTAEEIREDILKDPWDDDFKLITCIELKVSWLHYDTRNWEKELKGILQIAP